MDFLFVEFLILFFLFFHVFLFQRLFIAVRTVWCCGGSNVNISSSVVVSTLYHTCTISNNNHNSEITRQRSPAGAAHQPQAKSKSFHTFAMLYQSLVVLFRCVFCFALSLFLSAGISQSASSHSFSI